MGIDGHQYGAGEEGTCPVCARPIELDTLRQLVSSEWQRINGTDGEIHRLVTERDALQQDVRSLEDLRGQLRRAERDVSMKGGEVAVRLDELQQALEAARASWEALEADPVEAPAVTQCDAVLERIRGGGKDETVDEACRELQQRLESGFALVKREVDTAATRAEELPSRVLALQVLTDPRGG